MPTRCCSTRRVRAWAFWDGSLKRAGFAVERVDACLSHAPAVDVDKTSRDVAQILSGFHDPESKYVNTTYLAFCGPKDTAVRLIKSAIAGHYCAYTDLQNSSMLANLRGSPEFAEVLSAAKQCRDDFLAETSQTAH